MRFAKTAKLAIATTLIFTSITSTFAAGFQPQTGTHYFNDGIVGNNLSDPENLLFNPNSKNGLSGMSWSKLYPEKIWAHDDNYRGPSSAPYFMELMLVNPNNNAIEKTFRIDIPSAQRSGLNWEDMAISPSNDSSRNYLYVGDIGDNSTNKSVRYIYRLLEPNADQAWPTNQGVINAETIKFNYPNTTEDMRMDSEALIVDPNTKDILILQKKRKVETGEYYRQRRIFKLKKADYEASIANGTTITAELVGCIFHDWGTPSLKQITGANVSPDGREVLVRTYNEVYYYQKKANESLESLLVGSNTSCTQQVPTHDAKLPFLTYDMQGETITQLYDQSKYVTISEVNNGANNKIHTYLRDNQKPTANSDTATTQADTQVIIDALANDTDPESNTLTINSVSNPPHGSASIQNGKIVYTPDAGYVGTDTFGYYIKDQFNTNPNRAYYMRGSITVNITNTTSSDLEVTMPVVPTQITTGTALAFEVELKNNGTTTLTNPQAVIQLPYQSSNVSYEFLNATSGESCQSTLGGLHCRLGSTLAAGQSKRVRVTVGTYATNNGPLSINTHGYVSEQEPNYANNMVQNNVTLVSTKTSSLNISLD